MCGGRGKIISIKLKIMKIGKTLSILFIGMWLGVCLMNYGKEMECEKHIFNYWNFISLILALILPVYLGWLWGKEE